MVEMNVRKAWQRKHRKSWNKSPMHMSKKKQAKAKEDAKKKIKSKRIQ